MVTARVRKQSPGAFAASHRESGLGLALVLVEGLSYRETADVIGVPMGTVTSRLARARAALQTMLGEAT